MFLPEQILTTFLSTKTPPQHNRLKSTIKRSTQYFPIVLFRVPLMTHFQRRERYLRSVLQKPVSNAMSILHISLVYGKICESVFSRYESAYPDPYQNDPEHCLKDVPNSSIF